MSGAPLMKARLGRTNGCRLDAARSFLEKPGRVQALAARDAGALWNTMVMAVKAETLWELGWRYVPELMPRFESLLEAVDTPDEAEILDSVYRGMVRRNFSTHVLERARGRVALMPLTNVMWSDWGRPERILHTLKRLGKLPAWEVTGREEREARPRPALHAPGWSKALGALHPA